MRDYFGRIVALCFILLAEADGQYNSNSRHGALGSWNLELTPMSTLSSSSAWRMPTKPAKNWSSSSSAQEESHEVSKEVLSAFLSRDSRNKFICRVYGIVSIQLLVTVASVAFFAIVSPDFLRKPGLWTAVPLVSFLCSSVAWMIMYSSSKARRSGPLKWQLLSLFTFGEAFMVGFLSSFYTPGSVVASLVATACAAGGVSAYTIANRNSKRDLSQWGATLSSVGLVFVSYGFMTVLMSAGILPKGFLPYNEAVYGMMGATLFSFYLAYHTRMIVSGKHTEHQLNEKDYVFAAMTLYNDIINLFIYILKIIGEDRD